MIIPYTHADADLDPVYESFEPLSDEDKTAQSQCKSRPCQGPTHEILIRHPPLPDDPKLMHGAPVNLQIVAQRLEDEQLLRDVEMIDRVLNEGKTPAV